MDPKKKIKFLPSNLEGVKRAMAPQYAQELQNDQDTLTRGDMNQAGFGGMEDQLLPVSKALATRKKVASEAMASARRQMGEAMAPKPPPPALEPVAAAMPDEGLSPDDEELLRRMVHGQ